MQIEHDPFQRFAEGGAGTAGTAGNGAAAAGTAADTAGAAQADRKGSASAGRKGSASPEGAAEGAPGTGAAAQGGTDPAAETPEQVFEALITGPYKDLYDARVQGIVNEHLARARQTAAAAARMQNVMDVLARRYGKDGSDYEGILQAMDGDTALYAAEAAANGMDVRQYMQLRQLERERTALRREQAARREQDRAREVFADVLRQSEALRRQYPDFSLKAEMARPGTPRLLKAGVPLQAVYELNHRRELARAAAEDGARRVAESVAANRTRPPEAGAAGTGAAAPVLDPAKLTRAQRAEIKRRVANGERIVLSSYTPKP